MEPSDGSTGAPVDGTTYDQERFTVVLPAGWEGVSSEDDGYQERLTELQAEYEEDEQATSSLASLASVLDGGTISFIALDLNEANRTQNFIANMNVIAQDLGGQSLTLEDFVAVNMGALEAQEGLVGTVEQRPAQLGESEATAVTYTQEQGSFQNATYQFYTVSETHAYVVTFSADTENFDQVQPTFDMQKRKMPRDPNQRAKLIADMVLGEAEPGRLPRIPGAGRAREAPGGAAQS